MHLYDDKLTMQLIKYASLRISMDENVFMESIGLYWNQYTISVGYGAILGATGNTFENFIKNLLELNMIFGRFENPIKDVTTLEEYYDPKLKEELPYYDKFPLALILEKYNDGFLALNLHYLPFKWRVAFMSKLVDYGAAKTKEEQVARLRITYDILNETRSLREFRPCLKRYLYDHMQSRILAVQPNEWDPALALPIQMFKKESAKDVWADSLNEIRNS